MKEQTKVLKQEKINNYFSAYNQKDVLAMLKLFSHDAMISFIPLGENGAGEVNDLGPVIWSGLFSSFPNIRAKINRVKFDELKNYVCEVHITGTQVDDFAGIKNHGLSFKSDHIFVFHFDEQGKIDRMSVNWDHNDFIRQLGQ